MFCNLRTLHNSLGDVKSKLKWADGLAVKREVDLCIMLLLGPKTIDDLYPKKEKAPKSKPEYVDTGHSNSIMSENDELNNTKKGKFFYLASSLLIG